MDQAERLRQLINNKTDKSKNSFRVITVSSGKGGVGKTNLVVNLAIALQKKGFKVGILDADFGMANVDILLGIRANYSIYDMLFNEKGIEDISLLTAEGIKIIPGGSGIKELTELNDEKRIKLLSEFSKIENIDILIVDTGAGISKTVLNFVEMSDDVIVVTNSEPTALTDAYSLIKIIIKSNITSNIKIVVNKAYSITEARYTFNKLAKAVEVFLNKGIKYLGYIADDSKVVQAVKDQKPFMVVYPKCEASLCIQKISSELIGLPEKPKSSSIGEYFNKLLRVMGR